MRGGCYGHPNGHLLVPPPPYRTLRPHHQNGFGGWRGEDGFLRGAIIGRNIRDPASLLVKPPRTSCQHDEGRSLFTSTTPGRARVNSFHCPRPLVAEGGRKRVIPRFSCVSATRGGQPCSARSQFIALSDGLGAEGGSTASATVIPTSQFSICSKVRGDPVRLSEKQGWYGRQDRRS